MQTKIVFQKICKKLMMVESSAYGCSGAGFTTKHYAQEMPQLPLTFTGKIKAAFLCDDQIVK